MPANSNIMDKKLELLRLSGMQKLILDHREEKRCFFPPIHVFNLDDFDPYIYVYDADQDLNRVIDVRRVTGHWPTY